MGILSGSQWLRHLGITLLILGFVRLPLPASPQLSFGHRHALGGSCPSSLGLNLGGDSGHRNVDGASQTGFAWSLEFLSGLPTASSGEREEVFEDLAGDSECDDPVGDGFGSEAPFLRAGGPRSFARDLHATLDSVGLTADQHAPCFRPNLRPYAARNGTSPSYGPSLNALYQCWAC